MRTRIHSLIRCLTALFLLGHVAVGLGQTLSGRVYEGQTGSELPPLGDAKPLAGVTVSLYGSADANDDGSGAGRLPIQTTTTDQNGWYSLTIRGTHAFYNIIQTNLQTNQATYVDSDPSPAATSVSGTVKSDNWIQYRFEDLSGTTTGNKFWDKLEGQPPANQPPVANGQAASTNEDTAKAITLTASDPDGHPLTYHVMSQPSHGTLTGTEPLLTYTPAGNYNGPDSFTFRVDDGDLVSNTATVSITVNPVNDPPVADDQAVSTDEDTAIAITLTGSDPDGDPIVDYRLGYLPNSGALGGTPPSLTYTPDLNFNGTDSFTFVADDGSADSAPATVSITVVAVNDPQGAFHAVDGTTRVGLNEWHHVVGTYDASSLRLYVDGVEDPAGPVPYTGPINVNDLPVWIGANAEQSDRGFVGRIDEVLVYDGALTQAELLDLMALADNAASNN